VISEFSAAEMRHVAGLCGLGDPRGDRCGDMSDGKIVEMYTAYLAACSSVDGPVTAAM